MKRLSDYLQPYLDRIQPYLDLFNKEPQSMWPKKEKYSVWLYFLIGTFLHLTIIHMVVVLNMARFFWYHKVGRAFFIFTFAYGLIFYIIGDSGLLQGACLKSGIIFILEVGFAFALLRVPYTKAFFYFHLGKKYIEARVGHPF